MQRTKMRIGLPNNPRRNIIEEIEWIGGNKYDFVDLLFEEDHAVPGKFSGEETRDLLKERKLR